MILKNRSLGISNNQNVYMLFDDDEIYKRSSE